MKLKDALREDVDYGNAVSITLVFDSLRTGDIFRNYMLFRKGKSATEVVETLREFADKLEAREQDDHR